MECKNCKTKDELIIDAIDRAGHGWKAADVWLEKRNALQAELDHINKMTWWERLFGWPWDKKYKNVKMVRRD